MDERVETKESAGQYLSFLLDGESFAINVARIREIIDYSNLTRIPRMPDFMRGVINLRGLVVPVVDLRIKFNLGEVAETVDSCIVVMEVMIDDEVTVVGALVDVVQEVFELDSSQMEPPPKIGTRLDTAFIEGMGRRGSEFAIVLNPDYVFSVSELEDVQSASDSVTGDYAAIEAVEGAAEMKE